MGKISRGHGSSNLQIIAIVIALIALLCSTSISNPISESFFEAEARPAGASTLQSKIVDELRTNIQDITKKLRDVKGEKVPNQYIVVLKDNNLLSPLKVKSLAGEATNQGAALRHIYDHALGGFAIKVPNEKALEEILKIPEVDYVEPDIKVRAFVQSLPTGIDRVDADLSSTKSGDGSGAVNADIGILDTGIDLNHPDLNVYRQVTFVSGTSSGNDDNGHGTSVAGIAAAKDNSDGVVGIAPGARLWSVKVLDSSGNGFTSDIIEGIDYVTAHADEIDAANMSFGGEGSSTALRTAIINSVSSGVTYAAAAGNDDKDASTVIPASYPEVMAVSAIVDTDGKCGGLSTPTSAGNDDALADFSNFGSVVDIAAPGVLIKSTARGSSYTNSFSGTSASTPHVTGAAALYNSENPNATPSDIRNALRNSGSSPTTICDGNGHGYFTGDPDNNAEPLLYVASSPPVLTGNYHYSPSFVLTGSNYNDVASTSSLKLNQFSVAAWFKTSSNFGSDALIINKGGVGSDSFGQNMNYGIWMTSAEQIRAGFERSTGADQFVTSPNTYNNGQWHYAVVTNDGSTLRLYVDGVEVATKSTGGASPESFGTKPVRVGANSRVTPPGNFFTGEVDEVRVWNDDLTAQQAANAFAGTDFTTGKQVLHLPFGGNSSPVANNQAVNVIKDTQTPITLTATDPDNNPLTYTLVAQPQHGTVTPPPPADPGSASRTYTPTTDYVGPDSFTFKANDGTVDSNVATVSITVAASQQVGYNPNYAPSLVLTGTNYNDTPNAANLQLNQFSVAAWFKTSTNFASEAFIVNKGGIGSDSAGQNQNYQISMTSTEQIKVGFETSTGADQFVTSPLAYSDGQWHYVVVTNDGSTLRLYIDGAAVNSKSVAGSSPENTGTKPVRVGANSRVTPPGNFFTGDVDEVRIWNSVLTAAEVANSYGGTFKPGHVLYLGFASSSTTGYQYEPSLSLSGPS
jgi:subtilisin family serine protease